MSDSAMVIESLALAQVNIKIEGRPYILKEANGEAAVRYRNSTLKAARLADGKVTGMEGLADSEPLLVSLCLFEVHEDKERPVPLTTILKWPARVQKQLFNKAKEISHLDEVEDEAVLNEQLEALKDRIAKLKDADPN